MSHFSTISDYNKEKIEKKIPFVAYSKHVKYLGINVMIDVQNSYEKNYKALVREIELN